MVKIYTDGACTIFQVNGEYVHGSGGWAFCVVDEKNNILYKDSGGENSTTNNRMELMAILKGLEYSFLLPSQEIELYSDSAYCVNMLTNWIYSWVKNDWTRGKKKEPIQNLDIIKKIYKYIIDDSKTIKIIKVKGHTGKNDFNNYVDKLAVEAKRK